MGNTTDLRRQQGQQQRQHHRSRTTSAGGSNKPKKTTTAAAALRLLAVATSLILPLTTNAATYDVSPDGQPYSIAGALAEAGPGDTVSLADGTYDEPIVTVAGGESGRPLVIEGGSNAVISGYTGDRYQVVSVQHSWVTLRGFTIDGRIAEDESIESFVDKCVYVEGYDNPTTHIYRGASVKSSLIGFVLEGTTVRNCGGECVRLKNFVTNARILDNTIEFCGIYDYRFTHDAKNGEAVYVGTSSTQWTDGPDGSNHNLISGNVMKPFGNECVDVKEGATGNVIQNNQCGEQMDPLSGCFGSRGSGNTFRYNAGTNCAGAGIRLGGWEVDGTTYGIENEVYDNRFESTGAGSIAARQAPQGIVCGNTCEQGSGDCEVVGDDEYIVGTWNQGCPERLPAVPFIDDENYIEPTFTTSSTEESTTQSSEEDDNSSTTTSSTEESTTEDSEDDERSSTTSSSEEGSTDEDNDDDNSSGTISPSTEESTTQDSDDDDSSSTTSSSTEEPTTQDSNDDGISSTTPSSTEESTTQDSDDEDSSSTTSSSTEESTAQDSDDEDSSSSTTPSMTGESTTQEEEEDSTTENRRRRRYRPDHVEKGDQDNDEHDE